MEIHKPKTIEEAIKDLQQFLESDLYSKFRPDEVVNDKTFTREDTFPNEEEFQKYIGDHFDILRKEIKKLNSSNKPKTK